jgi:hypothetical protein
MLAKLPTDIAKATLIPFLSLWDLAQLAGLSRASNEKFSKGKRTHLCTLWNKGTSGDPLFKLTTKEMVLKFANSFPGFAVCFDASNFTEIGALNDLLEWVLTESFLKIVCVHKAWVSRWFGESKEGMVGGGNVKTSTLGLKSKDTMMVLVDSFYGDKPYRSREDEKRATEKYAAMANPMDPNSSYYRRDLRANMGEGDAETDRRWLGDAVAIKANLPYVSAYYDFSKTSLIWEMAYWLRQFLRRPRTTQRFGRPWTKRSYNALLAQEKALEVKSCKRRKM